jgi:cytidine deaminase
MKEKTNQQVSESLNQRTPALAPKRSAGASVSALALQPSGLSEDQIAELIAAATAVRERAYSPYSHFLVGAALRAADGAIYVGCNVENASYGLTICAERNAIAHAVAAGAQTFLAVAVVTENGVTPCGACRQVLAEFEPEMTVIVADTCGNRRVYTLGELLLDAFGPKHLAGD